MDYYSRYPEIVKMTSKTLESTIKALHFTFSRRKIPEILISDHGPQYASEAMKDFAKSIRVKPHHKQPSLSIRERFGRENCRNSQQSVTDVQGPYLALMVYRVTPFPGVGEALQNY